MNMSPEAAAHSRRGFLRLASLGVAWGAVLAACGGAAAPSSAPASAKPAGSTAASAKPAGSAAASAKPAASGAASAKPAASPAASGGGNQAVFNVAYPTNGGTHAPLWIAEEAGAFKDNGLNVQSQYIA